MWINLLRILGACDRLDTLPLVTFRLWVINCIKLKNSSPGVSQQQKQWDAGTHQDHLIQSQDLCPEICRHVTMTVMRMTGGGDWSSQPVQSRAVMRRVGRRWRDGGGVLRR